MDKRKKKRFFWDDDDIFDEMEIDFDDIKRMAEKMMRDMMTSPGISEEDLERMARDPNYRVFGFSIRITPEGKPIIREFGNIKPKASESKITLNEREPLIDVFESRDGKKISVIAEMPGVAKENIDLDLSDHMLIIKSTDKQRRYYKEVPLPSDVDSNDVRATYNNGVLTVEFKKVSKQAKKTKKIKID
ncbi:Hsp20/alpha crystallin family protein [Candidatus Micrarchaeota archaeon]|nr:Hsp20/alpha crystallin family protein [Candidatus Micrarchaeota archaeon]